MPPSPSLIIPDSLPDRYSRSVAFRTTVRGHSKQTLKSPAKFSYNDKGSMATIGRNKAVADIHFAKIRRLSRLAWVAIHFTLYFSLA
jgi:NADH dehydrogenase FAD-containing subunit